MAKRAGRLKTVTARVRAATVAFLEELAKAQDRRRRFYINEALEQYVAHRRGRVEEIKKAIAAADAGEFLSDEESEAFMRKWCGW